MKAEYISEGKNLDYVNPTDEPIAAGTVIMLGEICAVAATTINSGEVGAVATVGVWTLPKDASEITAGAKVYYDAENDVATITESGSVSGIEVQDEDEENDAATVIESNSVIGIAVQDAGADMATVNVRLNG